MVSRKPSWVLSTFESVLVAAFGATSGCAGPATPLGAVWDLKPQWDSTQAPVEGLGDDENGLDEEEGASVRKVARGLASVLNFRSERDPRIQFDPPRQWLHGSHTLKVIVNDPRGVAEDYGLEIRYHGHDVTRSFLLQARVTRDGTGSRMTIEVPSIRLSPMNEHLIEVGYTNPESGRRAVSRLRAPVCRAFARKRIQNLDEFHPDQDMTRVIEAVSEQMGFNPAFTAALIAQESAFNPRSVSLARALGLTQVTALAEEEVSGAYPQWPRYPGIGDMPAPMLKWWVERGEINAQNEWRLHPERSVRGGLAFARKLADRWQDSESFSKVSWTGGAGSGMPGNGDAEVASTKLILASYNSGYARVLQAVNRHGAAWLLAPELKEARKYVNRIFSYCDAFERAGGDETERSRAGGVELPAGAKPLSPSLTQKVLNENET